MNIFGRVKNEQANIPKQKKSGKSVLLTLRKTLSQSIFAIADELGGRAAGGGRVRSRERGRRECETIVGRRKFTVYPIFGARIAREIN